MSNDTEILLALPYAVLPTLVNRRLLGEKLREIGFVPMHAEGGLHDFGAHLDIWFYDGRGRCVEQIKALVLELPWTRREAPLHLQVLWQDDYTMQDDSMMGRKAPLCWVHEVWEVPAR